MLSQATVYFRALVCHLATRILMSPLCFLRLRKHAIVVCLNFPFTEYFLSLFTLFNMELLAFNLCVGIFKYSGHHFHSASSVARSLKPLQISKSTHAQVPMGNGTFVYTRHTSSHTLETISPLFTSPNASRCYTALIMPAQNTSICSEQKQFFLKNAFAVQLVISTDIDMNTEGQRSVFFFCLCGDWAEISLSKAE